MTYVVFNNIASGIANLCGRDVLNVLNVLFLRELFFHMCYFFKKNWAVIFFFYESKQKRVTLTILSK
jgi:hypothetical protein